MKIIFILVITLLLNTQLFTQWFLLNSGSSSYLYTVKFLDINTGWVVGDSKILRTTDGGINWVNQSPSSSIYIRAGFFLNQNSGWVAGSSDLIMITTNGGANWILSSAIPATNWHSIYFVNNLTGFICGTSGQIIKTTNGGYNWVVSPSGVTSYLFSTFFISETTGWTVGYDGKILKTTNTGISWVQQASGLTSGLLDVYFVNSNTGWAAGDFGIITKTTNGGLSWGVQASSGTTISMQGLDFLDAMTGWCVGADIGTIAATTNGGVNWNQQVGGGSLPLISIDMLNASTGFIAGFNGTILKTINGGYIGIQIISNEIPKDFSLSQNYPNPFNPSTNIEFDIPKSAHIKLTVYNILGIEVVVLVNEFLRRGRYRAAFETNELPSGTYFYKIASDVYSETKKMIFLK